MLFKQLYEGTVTQMDTFTNKKNEQHRQNLNRKIEAIKAERFAAIDMAISSTIDALSKQFGDDKKYVEDIVKAHIDDIFMMMDLERQ